MFSEARKMRPVKTAHLMCSCKTPLSLNWRVIVVIVGCATANESQPDALALGAAISCLEAAAVVAGVAVLALCDIVKVIGEDDAIVVALLADEASRLAQL